MLILQSRKKNSLNYKKMLLGYYTRYMGYEQRAYSVNQEYHRLIVSRQFNCKILKKSIFPYLYLDETTKNNIYNFIDLHDLFVYLHDRFFRDGYKVKKMLRMTAFEEFDETKLEDKTVKIIEKIGKKKNLQLNKLCDKFELLNANTKEKLGICKVTNNDYNGANIWTYVTDGHRREGYGIYLLFNMLVYLKKENKIPVFLISYDNTPAFRLARNLKLKVFTNEVIVSEQL